MALSPGTRLGPYEILAPLGAGGMGEVYRAKHLKLGREVAIKVLPDEVASNPERRQRFEREARAASSLNHPNTVTIHDIDEQDGTHYIAMELVEGATLRERLGQGPLPPAEMLAIATQVVAGLARAHAAGIVHRDLKPGNIMITEDGLVKILDFGLAKVGAGAGLQSELSTVEEVTREGAILGTVPYMSPEQAAGRPVDFRSDQFSFGSILYEMATGERAFEKDSSPETLAAIIEAAPPPVGTLNNGVPAPVVDIIERCLSRDPRGRYDSTGDLAKELARASSPSPASPSRWWLPTAGLIALSLLVAGVAYWRGSAPEAAPPATAPLVAVPLTSYPGREAEPTFSPDGSQVAFSWDGPNGDNWDIYVKVIGSEQPLRLTADPAREGSPAWSPDGRSIAFLRDKPGRGSEVLFVAPTGGAQRRIAEVSASADYGLAWSPDGRRLAVSDRVSSAGPLGLFLLDPTNGAKEQLTSPPSTGGHGDHRPAFSPDGRAVAFKRNEPSHNRVFVVSGDGGAARELAVAPRGGRVAWSADSREVVLGARPGAQGVSVSEQANAASPPALWRVAVQGGGLQQIPGTAGCEGVAVSGLSRRLVCTLRASDTDIWRLELGGAAPKPATRFAGSTRIDSNPRYSPDDQRVVFTSSRSGRLEIWVADATGSDLLRLTSMGERAAVGSPRWSPDGEWIAFDAVAEGAGSNADIHVVSAAGGTPRQVTTALASDFTPTWSRDGRWIYFSSNRSGAWQVWKVSSSGEQEGPARQVTRGEGFAPTESADGRYVYFARRRSGAESPGNAVWRTPVGGGEEVLVQSLASSYCNWDLNAEGLFFVDRQTGPSAAGSAWVVRVLRFKDRSVEDLARLERAPGLHGPAFGVSSDGRYALNAQPQVTSDLMLIENFR